jgi:hypothetical protein
MAEFFAREKASLPDPPLQSSPLCPDGGYVPGELQKEMARLKGAWR